MNEHDLKYIIEATLLAAGKPVTTQQLLELFDERERPTPELLQTALGMLAADYENRGIELIEVASGWRVQVRPRFGEIVSRLWQERPSKYSRALLETLALVAYRQPITRSEIEEIRGVSISSTIMRTLQERNWIRTVGHREVPGRPELLGTTREFLDYFGLKSLDQLPTLAELKDVETIGVQLELPADPAATASPDGTPEGEATASAEETVASSEAEATSAEAEAQPTDEGEEPEEVSAEASDGTSDESELSADADDGDEDSDVSPTMVASDEDDEHSRISEPPRED
jgi:segregation and condensation protein B